MCVCACCIRAHALAYSDSIILELAGQEVHMLLSAIVIP